MRVCVSNIIWKRGERDFAAFLDTLLELGVYNVELALSCIWDEPVSVSADRLKWLKSEFETRDIRVVSLHSLTHTTPGLELFESHSSRMRLLHHLEAYCNIARELGSKNLVFGSPNARKLYSYSKKDADEIFLQVLEKIDKFANGLQFNIEPLSRGWCDYLNSFEECTNIIRQNSFENIFVQLDARTFLENGEHLDGILRDRQMVRHVHVSNPGLTIPGTPNERFFQEFRETLISINYNDFVTAEVLANSSNGYLSNLRFVVSRMRELFSV